jgi:predicted RND superfamily exporter protein
MSVLINYRWAFLVIMVSLCIYGSNFISTAFQPNNDLEVWFDESDPALKAYYDFQKEFGNDRIITLAFKEANGILTPACLQKIKRLENGIEKLEGVNRVLSIVNAKDFRKFKEGQRVSYQFTSWFNEGLDSINPALKKEILTSSLYANRLINKKGDVTLLVIHFESFNLVHGKMDKIIPRIKSLCNEVLGEDNVHLSGADIIDFGLNELSRKDFIKFTGLSYLVMFILIAFFYRRIIYVISSFLIAFTAIWLTFAIYGFFGYGLNIFTVMTPTLVIVISIMMSMHIFNQFEKSNTNEFENKKEKAVNCLKEIVKPCFYAALTTIIGFLSLLTSSTAVIKEFGWLTSVGCFLAFVFAFVWNGVLLPYVNVQEKAENRSHNLGHAVSNFSGFILKKSGAFIFLTILISIVAILGIMSIKIDMNPMGFFPSNHFVAKDHQFMEDNWGDYYPIDIVLETEGEKKIDDRAIINALINFDAQIVDNNLASNTFSYVKVMERFAKVRYGEGLNKILKTPILNNNFSKDFKRLVVNESDILVTEDRKKARITITGSLQSVRVLEESIAEMNKISNKVFKNDAHINVSGYPALFIKIMNASFESMKSSLTVALLLVFLVIFLLLRNIKIAIVAIIVNVFPVLMMLGFLGFSGINLDLATCTIAAIILGIAIDDTIHILYRYQQEKKDGVSVESALRTTHFHVGRVVVLTSLVLLFGFSILLLASLKTVLYFGLLSMISVVAILYGDIILLTILLKTWK